MDTDQNPQGEIFVLTEPQQEHTATFADSEGRPILEFQPSPQPGWRMYFQTPDEGPDECFIGGRIDERQWALEQAQKYLRQLSEYHIREDRLRRAAERQGMILKRSRTHDSAYHTYMLVDSSTQAVVAEGATTERGYGLTLDEIEDRLG